MPIIFDDSVFQTLTRKIIGITLFDYFLINGFKNTYLNDTTYPLENCIYFYFMPEEWTQRFKEFCETLEGHKEYKCTYDVEKGVIIVFNIPEKFRKDVELVKEGKYSKTSLAYKKLFPQNVKDKKGNKTLFEIWMILNKHPQFKKRMEDKVGQSINNEAELWDAFNIKDEIINYNEEFVDINF
jgi:hypothetical protein